MSLNDIIQGAVVGGLLIWSGWRLLRAFWPSRQSGAGCGSGCQTCNHCSAAGKDTPPEAGVVQWRTPTPP